MTPERATSVLDASALLAYVHREPGNLEVETALAERAIMNVVNYAEVLSRLNDTGNDAAASHRSLEEQRVVGDLLQIVPVTEDDAVTIGRLRPLTRHLGLSLGDRACLATGLRFGLPVLTTDRVWAGVAVDVQIRLIRS